jgi:hypothetical protein
MSQIFKIFKIFNIKQLKVNWQKNSKINVENVFFFIF